jgi:DNA repair protein RecO (recombination protein O)
MATSEGPGAATGSPAAALPAGKDRLRRAPGVTGRPRRAAVAHPMSAYVLHQYDWSESSLVVELFTRAQGRVVVVAKGAKRPTSNFRPVLLPFLPLQVQLGKPPKDDSSEVVNLRSAEWCGGVPLLPQQVLLSAYYLNELLLKLLARQDPHPELFDAYADTLVALAQAPLAAATPLAPVAVAFAAPVQGTVATATATAATPVKAGVEVTVATATLPLPATSAAAAPEAAVLRAFELVLLRELGVLPELGEVTLTAQPLQPEQHYALHADHGLVPESKSDTIQGAPGAAWLAVEPALNRGTLAQLRQCCAPVAAALRGPLRGLLHYHLGQRPLRTRQVWKGVQRLAESPRP